MSRGEEADLMVILSVLLCAAAAYAINVAEETLLTFSQLAKRIPPGRNGRPVHPATVHRWRGSGVRGIRLPSVRIGGTWYTSVEAYQEWTARLTAAADQRTLPSVPPPPPDRSARDAEVERRLDLLDPVKPGAVGRSDGTPTKS